MPPTSDDIHRNLGRLEGAFEVQTCVSETRHREVMAAISEMRGLVLSNQERIEGHMADDAAAFARIGAGLDSLSSTVDRIKKPVDMFISLRNLIVGAAALVAAVGGLFGYARFKGWG